MTTTATSTSSSSSRRTAAAATPRQRHQRWRRRTVAAAVAAAAAVAVLVRAPSSALAFVVSVPAPATTTPRPRVGRWQGAAAAAAVAGTPFATTRRAFTLVPSRVAAAAADEEEEEEDDDEEEGPRPPRPFTPPPIPISYESEALPSKTIDGAWNALRKPLLRLGTKGVQKSHRNSLKELLAAHRAVRVKVNGPAHDVKPTAERLAAPDPGETDPLAVLLRVKGKEFLLATPAEVAALKKGKAPGAAPE